MFKKLFSKNHRGSILLFIMIFGSVAFTLIVSGIAGYAIFENQASNRIQERDEAFHIAEAGINYYRWHLAHSPTDYYDGTGSGSGPYVHEYKDKNGDILGYYSLQITPPLVGSTVVTVKSTGYTVSNPSVKRAIQSIMGAAALTDYAFLCNAPMAFSFTTVVHGPVHSNDEIRFDGTSDSWVRSHVRVQGGGGPKSFWQYPVPEIDFFNVSTDLDNIRKASNNGGLHLYSSGKEGYHIVFNNNTFKLYKVTSRDCYYGEGQWRKKKKNWYWDGTIYCYDIGNQTLVSTNNIPANGAIFVEDDVWVDGMVDGRVSVGVGEFPEQEPYHKIYISNNLTYKAKASDDVIGLFAQGEIVVPYEVPDTMKIDAAMLSQYESLGRPYYDSDLKSLLTIFGSQISYTEGGWKWVNGWGHVISGFEDTEHTYDANLKYYPPPGFPVGNTYELISWNEVAP